MKENMFESGYIGSKKLTYNFYINVCYEKCHVWIMSDKWKGLYLGSLFNSPLGKIICKIIQYIHISKWMFKFIFFLFKWFIAALSVVCLFCEMWTVKVTTNKLSLSSYQSEQPGLWAFLIGPINPNLATPVVVLLFNTTHLCSLQIAFNECCHSGNKSW